MRIQDLDWLVTVAELGHVTDSAATLGTTQPTLSRSLARVERELGVRVFERVPDGVRVTPVGGRVVEAARDLVDRHRRLLADLAAELDAEGGTCRLAFLDSISTSLVPRLLGEVHRALPRLRVQLRQEPAHEISADLASGAAELAVTSYRPSVAHHWLPLQHERLVLVVPPTHRWRTRRAVTLAELGDEELVTVPTGFGYRALVDDLLRDAGVAPVVSFESQDLATIEGLVAAGLGVGIVPEPFAGQSGTLGLRIRSRAAQRTIALTWLADRPLLPPAARFVEVARSQAAG